MFLLPFLYTGVILAVSQSSGSVLVLRDCVKSIWRMGAILEAGNQGQEPFQVLDFLEFHGQRMKY